MPKNEVELVFEINGAEVSLTVNPNEPLQAARNQALAKSKNTGRPPDDWVVQDASSGAELPLDKKVGTFGFTPGVHLVLVLRVGAGG